MKKWHQSKTIWFNLATLVVALSAVALQYIGQLGLSVEEQLQASLTLTAINTIANLGLRKLTTMGVG